MSVDKERDDQVVDETPSDMDDSILDDDGTDEELSESDDDVKEEDPARPDETPDENEEEDEEEKKHKENQPKSKKPSRYEKRVKRLLMEKHELERQLASISEHKPAGDSIPEPVSDNYEDYQDFLAAKVEYEVAKRLSPSITQAEKNRIQTSLMRTEAERRGVTATSFVEKATEFAAAHPDFRQVFDSLSKLPVKQAIIDAVVESDNGPAIAYELGKRPDLVESIHEMSTVKALVEIGRIEAAIAARPNIGKPRKTATTAPQPTKRIQGKSPGKVNLSKMSAQEIVDYEFETLYK